MNAINDPCELSQLINTTSKTDATGVEIVALQVEGNGGSNLQKRKGKGISSPFRIVTSVKADLWSNYLCGDVGIQSLGAGADAEAEAGTGPSLPRTDQLHRSSTDTEPPKQSTIHQANRETLDLSNAEDYTQMMDSTYRFGLIGRHLVVHVSIKMWTSPIYITGG